MDAADNRPGTVLTCTNAECGCQLTIDAPCPHGSTYRCACGHDLVAETPATGGA